MMRRSGMCVLTVFVLALAGPWANAQADYGSAVIYPLPQYEEAKTAAVGDLNGDGREDVAVAAWPSELYLLYQQGDGSLGPPNLLYAPQFPLGLATGDLNGDGRKDLVVGGMSGEIVIYHQQSNGAFDLPVVCTGYGLMNSLVVDDLNGDGRADIAGTAANLSDVLVFFQSVSGEFGVPAVYTVDGWNARCILTLDYNSDGRRDLALLLDGQACYLAGTSLGGFEAPKYAPAAWSYALAAGDVTGDGRDDLVYSVPADQPYAALGVVPQSFDGHPDASVIYPSFDFPEAVAVADVNGDGRNDVIAVHAGYEAVTVMSQDASGGLGAWNAYATPLCNRYEPGALAVGDLNSDGLPDLVIADQTNGLVVIPHTPRPAERTVDTTPPTCTATVSGTTGSNGWYTSAVTVTLTAEDDQYGSGVSSILYTLDGTTWLLYSNPIAIARQGTTSIGYYAEDNAGNRSEVGRMEVKLDSTRPKLRLRPSIRTLSPPNGEVIPVSVHVEASDNRSGIGALRLSVEDEYGQAKFDAEVKPGEWVQVPLVASTRSSDKDGRTYTLILAGTDAAGNTAKATSTVTVPHGGSGKDGRG